ncbi:AraC family transcriptional regulator [Paenibacillus psychroresistens]|uniref:AraC family transcriptional regulator n=1 Tax=Paenibacillus psychroresistens TaxID=1778678 RepID=A0A6B8RR09_9BACL|nr:AraC family transcriptional regulator [Paenibacillus psychroresistens]QGQ98287.1 AraC family transcriptional regulator [Paenibacillus psychroresistens]
MDIEQHDIVPYIRQADYAIRAPFWIGERNLLDYILFYVQEGLFEIQARGKLHVLKEGDFCLLQPGDIHTIKGINNTINPHIHLDFFYNPLRAKSFITLPGQLDMSPHLELIQPRLNDFTVFEIPITLQLSQPQKMRDLLFKTIELWQRQSYISQMQANQCVSEIILTVIKDYMKPQTTALVAKPILNWITSYISFYFSEPITIQDMAKRAGISPSRFQVVFKQAFGISPHQYLLRVRIDHAKELMKSFRSIQLVSEYCGFSDVHHFSNAFKKATGYSPAKYRDSIMEH